MSKKITFNIKDYNYLPSLLNNFNNISYPVELNINIESTKRSYDQIEKNESNFQPIKKYTYSNHKFSNDSNQNRNINNDQSQNNKSNQELNEKSSQNQENDEPEENSEIEKPSATNKQDDDVVQDIASESDGNVESSSESDMGSDGDSNMDSGSESDMGSDGDSNMESGGESDMGGESDSNMESGAESNMESEIEQDEDCEIEGNIDESESEKGETPRLTQKQIMEELENQINISLKEQDNKKESTSHVLYSLKKKEIQKIADYLDKYIIKINECHILPPNIENLEKIGKYYYYKLDNGKIKVNIIYWYLNTDEKNDLKKSYRLVANRCTNSFCVNPEHLICECYKPMSRSRLKCFKSNAALINIYKNEIERLMKEEKLYNPTKAKNSISNYKCTHQIKCIGFFLE